MVFRVVTPCVNKLAYNYPPSEAESETMDITENYEEVKNSSNEKFLKNSSTVVIADKLRKGNNELEKIQKENEQLKKDIKEFYRQQKILDNVKKVLGPVPE